MSSKKRHNNLAGYDQLKKLKCETNVAIIDVTPNVKYKFPNSMCDEILSICILLKHNNADTTYVLTLDKSFYCDNVITSYWCCLIYSYEYFFN